MGGGGGSVATASARAAAGACHAVVEHPRHRRLERTATACSSKCNKKVTGCLRLPLRGRMSAWDAQYESHATHLGFAFERRLLPNVLEARMGR